MRAGILWATLVVVGLSGCRSKFSAIDAGADAAGDADPIDAGALTSPRWQVSGLLGYGRRVASVAAYDTKRNRFLLYGGEETLSNNNIVNRADLWSFDGTGWELLCRPCAPGPRHHTHMVFDSERDRLVLFGISEGPY